MEVRQPQQHVRAADAVHGRRLAGLRAEEHLRTQDAASPLSAGGQPNTKAPSAASDLRSAKKGPRGNSRAVRCTCRQAQTAGRQYVEV